MYMITLSFELENQKDHELTIEPPPEMAGFFRGGGAYPPPPIPYRIYRTQI
jgi:hypothetical protein